MIIKQKNYKHENEKWFSFSLSCVMPKVVLRIIEAIFLNPKMPLPTLIYKEQTKNVYFLISYVYLYSPQKSFKGKPIIDERQFHEKIAGLLPVTVV